MSKMYQAPVAEVITPRWENGFCILSNTGTETVGIKPALDDNDFE